MSITFDQAFIARFWSRVNKGSDINACWKWTGPTFQDNRYGQVSFKTIPHRAHRISWMIHFGPIPDGKLVLHSCDCRVCVRPDHLWLGTNRDNINDMIAKGRSLTGEKNHKAKVSARQVIQIRVLWSIGRFRQQELADIFGLKQSQISSIVNRQTWKHVA